MAATRQGTQAARIAQLEDELASCLAQVGSLRQEVSALRRELHGPDTAERGVAEKSPPSTPGPSPASAALRWLEAHYDDVAREYRGLAIAILGECVVAADPELEVVVERARQAGYAEALFTSIPTSTAAYRA